MTIIYEKVEDIYGRLYGANVGMHKYEYTDAERTRYMNAIECRDTDSIPKVKNAGKIVMHKNHECQVMHNGVKILKGCYHQQHMTDIIENLQGHHEPQEEKLFHEILKYVPDNGLMIECGSFWAYYSMWFNKEIKNARNIMIEPWNDKLELGRINFHLNDMQGEFVHGWISDQAPHWLSSPNLESPLFLIGRRPKRISIDGLLEKEKIKRVDILHADAQECEVELLWGAVNTIRDHKIKFIFLSTHQKDHQQYIEFLSLLGYNILQEFTIEETYFDDGLILACAPDVYEQIDTTKLTISRKEKE